MIIKRVELKNWGPHKSLEFDSDNHIVGIIGSNGKGKSNLLQAIAYALTGDLDKNKGTSYIRHFGSPNAAKEASVKIVFQKGTEEGTIIRKIKDTGTTSRQMTWGGKTVKSAAEVEKLMSEILGADKEAMRNAVYIKQGDIARLVKGTAAERQEINLKLMNLHFTEYNADQVRKAKAIASNGLVDYYHIEAMLAEHVQQLLANKKEYETKLEPLEESHSQVVWLNSVYNASVNKANTARMMDSIKSQIIQKSGELKALLSNAKCESILELEQGLADKKSVLDAYRKYIKYVYDVESKLEEIKKLRLSLISEINKLNLLTLNSTITDESQYTSAVERIQQISDILNDIAEVNSIKTTIASYTEERDNCIKSADEIQKVIDELNSKRTALLNLIFSINRNIAIAGIVHSEECPICNGKVSMSVVNSFKSSLESNKKQLEDLEAKYNELEKQINGNTQSKNSSLGRANSASKLIAEYSTKLCEKMLSRNVVSHLQQEYNKIALREEKEKLQASINAYRIYQSELTELRKSIAKYETRIESLEKLLESINKEAKDTGIQEINAEYTRNVHTNIPIIEAEIRSYTDTINTAKAIQSKLEQLNDTYTENTNNYDKYEEVLTNLQENRQVDADILTMSLTALEELVTTYRNKELDRGSLISLINKTENELKEAQFKLDECHANIEKNNKKLQLIEDLQAIIEVTCKNGIPLAYANEVFAHITPMVQEMLERMQANFTVTIDPERPMTYKFVRTDDDSGYEMAQERLSGGQAIRLAIALLIACQQAILPDVGLLILDEPSSHIDAEGVEHMRDMFIQLEDILKNSNMQVLLVDHNPTLVAAFDKTIKL